MATNKGKQFRLDSERDLLLLRQVRVKGGRVFQRWHPALNEVARELVTLQPEIFTSLCKKSGSDRVNLLLYDSAASGEGGYKRVLVLKNKN